MGLKKLNTLKPIIKISFSYRKILNDESSREVLFERRYERYKKIYSKNGLNKRVIISHYDFFAT